jgi:hypothetical protein
MPLLPTTAATGMGAPSMEEDAAFSIENEEQFWLGIKARREMSLAHTD